MLYLHNIAFILSLLGSSFSITWLDCFCGSVAMLPDEQLTPPAFTSAFTVWVVTCFFYPTFVCSFTSHYMLDFFSTWPLLSNPSHPTLLHMICASPPHQTPDPAAVTGALAHPSSTALTITLKDKLNAHLFRLTCSLAVTLGCHPHDLLSLKPAWQWHWDAILTICHPSQTPLAVTHAVCSRIS